MAAVTICLAVACPMLFATFFAERMIFRPSPSDEFWDSPGHSDFEELELIAPDGVKTVSWYLRRDAARCTLIFFHGNAGHLAHRAGTARALATLGADVFLVGYHGYGKSDGRAGEAVIYQDADTAWRYLAEQRGVPPSQIVPFGESLGCAPALDLATRRACAGVILQSPFSSIRDMARKVLPIFPGHWLVRTKMDNVSKIQTLSVPALICATTGDEVVPYGQSKRVFEAAGEPKTWVEFSDCGHNDLVQVHQRVFLERIGEFLDRTCPK